MTRKPHRDMWRANTVYLNSIMRSQIYSWTKYTGIQTEKTHESMA